MKLVKSLQKTLQPFTKMVKKSNKLMFLLGVLLLLGLVLLVKMYMKKREGFNENDIIVLENIVIESVNRINNSVDEGWKIFHREVKNSEDEIVTNVREADSTKGGKDDPPPSPLTIKYHRSEKIFTIHTNHEGVEWNFVWSNMRPYPERTEYNLTDLFWVRNAEFSKTDDAKKMIILFIEKDSDDNPKYRIQPIINENGKSSNMFLNYAYNTAYFTRGLHSYTEFYFIDTNNNKKIDLFAKISEIEKTNEMSELKTNFDLDVQPTDIDNAITKINTKYTTDFKRELKKKFDVAFTDTNTVNTVIDKAKTKYVGLQTVLKNQGFMYRPAPAPT